MTSKPTARERLDGIKKMYANNDDTHTVKFLVALVEVAIESLATEFTRDENDYPKGIWKTKKSRLGKK